MCDVFHILLSLNPSTPFGILILMLWDVSSSFIDPNTKYIIHMIYNNHANKQKLVDLIMITRLTFNISLLFESIQHGEEQKL